MKSTQEYNTTNNNTSLKRDMNSKRASFGITYDDVSKTIYVFGGDTGKYMNHCEKYSIRDNKWNLITPMAKSKANVSACIFDHKFIFIIGGFQ